MLVLENELHGLHYRDITKKIIDNHTINLEWKTPWNTINAILNTDIKTFGQHSKFIKVPGKPWYFALNTESVRKNFHDQWLWLETWNDEEEVVNESFQELESPQESDEVVISQEQLTRNEIDPTTQYIGKWWELAVSSELLFKWFNTSIPNVDDGIDIIATKNNQFYYFQVKSITKPQENIHNFPFRVKCSSFDRWNNNSVYYVFVVRHKYNDSIANDYLIVHNNILSFMIQQWTVTKSINGYYCFNIRKSQNQWLIGNNDITHTCNNRWSIN